MLIAEHYVGLRWTAISPDVSSGDKMSEQVDGATKLRVCEAASHLKVSKSWLDKKRLTGGGPPFMKFGRRVVYDMGDLEKWAAANRRHHTAEVCGRET